MPTTSKRFYITRSDDHAVIKTVPVQKSVCAAPQRVDLGPANDSSTGPVEQAVQVVNRPEARSARQGRVSGRLHRPHLPNIGRFGR